MTKKITSDKFILVKSDEDQNQNLHFWTYVSFLACTVITFGALLTVSEVQIWLTGPRTPQVTFRLLATRSSASVLLWSPHSGNGKPLSEIDITFSEELGNPTVCDGKELDLCVKWLKDKDKTARGLLQVNAISSEDQDAVYCRMHVIIGPDDTQIDACIPLQGDQLYGGPITSTQYWPSQNNTRCESPYVTGLGGNEGIVEPYWLTSSGNAIFVPPDVSLFVSQNETHLCLTSKIQEPYLPDHSGTVTLKYILCSGSNPVITHLHTTRNFIPLPRDIPDERMFQHPIWSTWAQYKKVINTFIINDFAKQIVYYGFNNSQLEIDDNWEFCYGAAEFFNKTFDDPKSLIESLKRKGFRVTLWTHPFINIDCPAHTIATKNQYLATNADMTRTLTVWWDGIGGVINFTNPDAVSWWKGRLQNLSRMYDIDAFKFDAGEAAYLPGAPEIGKLAGSIRLQPNIFTTEYVKTVASISDLKLAEVRVIHRNQGEPIFVRMSDKSSIWSIENGLKAIVTTLLAMNMVGYSFIIPDMVGGNGYVNIPTKELFIRWLQANTFMPTIQFSYTPWDFDEETVQIAKKFTTLHFQFSDKILKLAKKKVADGTPINLPLWWLDPSDEEALTIDSGKSHGQSLS
ncbi:hypothetical protein B7P43_G04891 [Cryptotermes secundus]|uniref:Glycoside hydrolase family 31 TIM barrel domain-containing protein n=1 Tax=Cryptotermes secundus TaxID=105785 RepID=A0A2J7QV16_9NEOP|nr:hypothetical protein B7P43_G04891 [Cryptotermes secundus]